MSNFCEGDAVWIDDGYAGAPHAATVTSIGDRSLWAESTRRVPGDSRVSQWEIRTDLVAEMVSVR